MLNLEEEKSKFVFTMELDIRWSDMDTMQHVNNAVYLTYFEQARIAYFQKACAWNWNETGAILASAHVDYLRPVVYPDPTFIYVRTSKIGSKSFEVRYLITSMINGNEVATTTGYTTMVLFDYESKKSVIIPEQLRNRISEYEIVKP